MNSWLYSPCLAKSFRKIFDKTYCSGLWMGNILLHHQKAPGALQAVTELFKLCAAHSYNFRPEKCTHFAQFAQWCGRLRSEKDMKFDPRRMKRWLEIEVPTILQPRLPEFSKTVETLQSLLKRVYIRVDRRGNQTIVSVQFSDCSWITTEKQDFEHFKVTLHNLIKLS